LAKAVLQGNGAVYQVRGKSPFFREGMMSIRWLIKRIGGG